MSEKVKFVHTNIIARDWRKLAQFYIDLFNCEPVYPERDLSGEEMDKLTKIPDVTIKGIHLKLPGCNHNFPMKQIIEVFKWFARGIVITNIDMATIATEPTIISLGNRGTLMKL